MICVPWHCSVSSQPVQRLGAPFAWSATLLSFTWWHWWSALRDGVIVCQFTWHVISRWRCGCVFRFVWRARAWNSARGPSADLRHRPPTDDMFEEVLLILKTTTRERHSFWHEKNTSTCAATGKDKFCLAPMGGDGRFGKATRKTHTIGAKR